MFYSNKQMLNNFHKSKKFYSRRQLRFYDVFVSSVDVRDYSVSTVLNCSENKNPLDIDFAIRFDEEQPLPTEKEKKADYIFN